nr:protein lethal(2)essential for life [Diamesa zernyi]
MSRSIEVDHDASNVWDWPLSKNEGVVRIINTADHFEVGLSVSEFSPKEIEVKLMNNDLVLRCQHDERQDKHGRISREIHRTYRLPSDVDQASLKSTMQRDGVLIITAGKKK